MRILLTGGNGFIGGHMAEALLAEGGHTLTGLSRTPDWPAPLKHLAPSIPLHLGELADTAGLTTLLGTLKPDWIFHFAGYANTAKSFKEADLCWKDNLDGTRSLYDAVIKSGTSPRILFVSTGLIYGDGELCSETTELRPASPYAASKAAADVMSFQYAKQGLHVIRVRLFNQIGPRQSADYSIANFARQIAAVEAGKQSVIETGDLSAKRDITDVRDIVTAFRLLMEKGVAGEAYNAGRGETYQIQHALDKLIALAKVPVEVKVKLDPNRKADTVMTRADTTKLKATTGWQPKYSLEESLRDILEYWRILS
ncbi:GDP-mannose 4,6-dehydratase [soil metagenome]